MRKTVTVVVAVYHRYVVKDYIPSVGYLVILSVLPNF